MFAAGAALGPSVRTSGAQLLRAGLVARRHAAAQGPVRTADQR
ncbi:hypothetical protein [Streptomyces sp. cg35]